MSKKLLAALLTIILSLGAFYLFNAQDEAQNKTESSSQQAVLDVNGTQKIQNNTKNTDKNATKSALTNSSPSTVDTELQSLLRKVKNNQLRDISKKELRRVIALLQNNSKTHTLDYKAIEQAYQSGISDSAKIFLASLLGEISTYESAVSLTNILDFDAGTNPSIVYENKRAIDNLIFDNTQGKTNNEVSPALIKYWENSDNKLYKPSIAKAVLQIGNVPESQTIINRLNTPVDKNEISYISSAMKEIRSEDATALLFKKYNAQDSSDVLKNASLEALPYIANKTAILSLYNWSSTLSSDEDKKRAKEYFQRLKQRNPQAEGIVKEELYSNNTPFTSKTLKTDIEKIFKK